MFILYDLIFIVFAVCYLPVFLLKRKFHPGFVSRFGYLPPELRFNKPIWIHAVSVGEMMAVKPFIACVRKVFPDKQLVISTVTATGNSIAVKTALPGDIVLYLPLDLSCAVKKYVERIAPEIFIAAETELWPNLITCLSRKNIPFVVINGRISDASFQGYRRVSFLLRGILNKVSLYCVQTISDRQKLLKLGLPEDRIRVAGNIKFDISVQRAGGLSDCRVRLGLSSGHKLLIAGSTHLGEEQMLLRACRSLQGDFPDLRLLLAPRHPERAKEVERTTAQQGFHPVFVSRVAGSSYAVHQSANTVFILDTVGELSSCYAGGDIAFVGGSLIRKGGHNILEPAAFGKPVIFGPYMFNFRDIAELFLQHKAALLARDEEELEEKIRFLLESPPRMAALGEEGKKLIALNQGATLKSFEYIKSFIEKNR
ncbi:MAG: 3-deoxy-D-manno-octulosonic acid transferase [Candidatus Omnitrophica bacterium]|nr:3-deoxy-D-manno-octulosonic acid transferase [Candidatus Omnitrophota bacterium]